MRKKQRENSSQITSTYLHVSQRMLSDFIGMKNSDSFLEHAYAEEP